MREVNFRTVDKYFIKMSTNDKIWLIFILFFLALSSAAVGRYFHDLRSIEQHSMLTVDTKLHSWLYQNSDINLSVAKLAPNVKISSASLMPSREKNSVTSVARAKDGRYVSWTQDVSAIEKQSKQDALLTLGLTYLWLIPFGLLCYWVATFIGGAQWVLWKTTEKIAKGDLSSRLGFYPGRDEFGVIGYALDQAMDTLTELVSVVKKSSETFEGTLSSFEAKMQHSESQIREQNISLDSVATAMEQMSASADNVSRIANSTTERSETDAELVANSQNLVSNTISEIEQLSDYIINTSNSVESLKENTNQINEVLDTIKSISEQTNLLALNAAIEAARAGEQGRGFAVVADEVRALASRTQEATLEIQEMMTNLQGETTDISGRTEKIVHQAQVSKDMVMNLGTDIDSVAESSKSVLDMSIQISTSANEQSTAASSIAGELSDIRSHSDEIKSVAHQQAEGISELTLASKELNKVLAGYQTS